MPFHKLLSKDRELFVWKTYNEMDDNALVNTPDRENKKAYFLQLVEGNEELSGIEKQFCRERYIYNFESYNVMYKRGKSRECNKCKMTRYSDKYCERCISLQLQSLFNTWTSG